MESPQGKAVKAKTLGSFKKLLGMSWENNVLTQDESQWAEWPFSFSIFMDHSCHTARYVKKKRLRADSCEIYSSETWLHMYQAEEPLLLDTH